VSARVRRALLTVAAATLLAGCGATPAAHQAAGVAVDTAQLRAVKHRAGIASCRPARGRPVTGGLPRVTLPCLGGGPAVDLAGLRGPLVVNLWAQWCGPCRAELPRYEQFARKYAGTVRVLGIDYQDTQPLWALQLAARSGVTYPLLADPDGRLSARGLPKILMVDARGKVVYDEYGEITSVAQLERLVARHLHVTSG
jgi:thiol-disulfide isomerase/thioredoxin